jgi:transcriptional regulator with GAF, ATPase, and Fis domain
MEFHLENIIGKSKAIRDVLEMVKKVAPTMARSSLPVTAAREKS